MFLIGVWRLIYHLLCLAKALGYRGKPVYYFAFGANLDPAVLAKRNINPLDRQEHMLLDFKLTFNHEIPFEGVGMASIEPCQGQYVPGVVYKISKIDQLRMDCFESCLVFGRYKKQFVKPGGGKRSIYFYRTMVPKEGLRPTPIYLNKLLTGYKLVKEAPKEFIDALAQTKTVNAVEMRHPPQFLVQDYELFSGVLKSVLVAYDKVCVNTFVKLLYKRSIFEAKAPTNEPIKF